MNGVAHYLRFLGERLQRLRSRLASSTRTQPSSWQPFGVLAATEYPLCG